MASDPFHEYRGPETPASDLFYWTADERFQLGRISRWDNSFAQPLGWYVWDRWQERHVVQGARSRRAAVRAWTRYVDGCSD